MSGTEILLLCCVAAMVMINLISNLLWGRLTSKVKKELISLYERYQSEAQRYILAQQDWQATKSAVAKSLRDADLRLEILRGELDRKEITESAYNGATKIMQQYETFARDTAEKCGSVAYSGYCTDQASGILLGVIEAYKFLPSLTYSSNEKEPPSPPAGKEKAE